MEELKRLSDGIPSFPSCRTWQEGNKGISSDSLFNSSIIIYGADCFVSIR